MEKPKAFRGQEWEGGISSPADCGFGECRKLTYRGRGQSHGCKRF